MNHMQQKVSKEVSFVSTTVAKFSSMASIIMNVYVYNFI
jgi:hypothetical protein